MKTGILVALAALSLVGVGIFSAAVLAAPHTPTASTQGGMQGGYGNGMMNGGNGMMGGSSGGMMGGGGCPYNGNYASCQQYMYEHNASYGGCPMMD